ncbi:MAG: FAD binding domain-containing protein [bacterium]
MRINKYVKSATVAEAHRLLKSETNAALVGGGAYLRLSKRRIGCAVDLFEAGLDYVRKNGKGLELGAMATFRQIETDPLTLESNDGLLARAVGCVVGVQLRNLSTVGGSVGGKYGFSNLITALLALDAEVVLHKTGAIGLADYLQRKRNRLDLVTAVVVPRRDQRASFQIIQKTHADYGLLNVAVVRPRKSTGDIRIAVGARPGVAKLASKAMAYLETVLGDKTTRGRSVKARAARANAAEEAARLAASELAFGDDVRASAWYRRQVCSVLVQRALEEVLA